MKDVAGASVVPVARQLALASATVEVLDAMARAGIRTVMLKGAAIATRLYDDPSERPAGDVDLLVEPNNSEPAARVLEELGFHDSLRGARADERPAHSATFRRSGSLPAEVDLHVALYFCSRDPHGLWSEFSRATTFIDIDNRPVEVLADSAQALVIAAHALQHPSHPKPREDLARALSRYDRETWADAGAMARRLEADGVLAASLKMSDTGARLASELLPGADSDCVEIRLHLAGAPTMSLGVMRLVQTRSIRERLRLVLRELFPSPPFMRELYPFAARGRKALAIAYVCRPLRMARRLPPAVRAWRRARAA